MKSQSIEMNRQELNHQPETINQKESWIMKSQLRVVTLSLLAILCLAAAVVPASAQCTGTYIYNSNPQDWHGVSYLGNNAIQIGGPATPGATGAPPWPTSGSYAGVPFGVSQPFTLSSAATISCLEFLAWEYPELLDAGNISTLYWSLDSTAFGVGPSNTNYGSGTGHIGAQLHQPTGSFGCPTNDFGYYQCVVGITLPPGGLKLSAGPYYLTLTLGTTVVSGDPLYWDQYLSTGLAVQRPPTGPAGTMTFAIY